MTSKKFPQSGGFTLVETMVAIAILLISVVGPISIIGGSLNNIYFVRDQMTAINLAQEGIEVVRQRRDTNFLKDTPTSLVAWDDGFASGDCPGSKGCVVDANPSPSSLPPQIYKCVLGCPLPIQRVYTDSTDGFYHQYNSLPGGAGITPTNFIRRVDTTRINGNEYRVDVVVTWTTGGKVGSVTASENIFKWAKL